MTMILRVLIMGGVMACAPSALAELTIDAGRLGHMKAVLDVCGKTAPRQASDYLLQVKALIGRASKPAVDEVSRTEEYRQAYQAVRSELGAMAADERASACTSYLATTH